MSIFLLLNAFTAGSSFLVASRIFTSRKAPLFFIIFSLCYLSLIVFGELLVGVLGRLTLANILLFHILIFVFLYLLLRKSPQVAPDILPEKWLVALQNNRLITIAVAVILGFGLVKAGINLINPPFGWDSLNYHFTFPVEWIKNAHLDNPITVSDDPSPTYYPINGSLIYLWLLWPLKSAFLADLGQAPFYLLGLLSVYLIAKRMRLSAENAFLSACLFTLIPNYFKQIEIAYVDVMVSSLFLSSCVFLFEFNERPSRKNALLFGASTGLLLGTKTVALPYTALLLAPFIYVSVKKGCRNFTSLLSSLAAIAVLGGFSYLRNYLDTGNPLYPFDYTLFGKSIFKGVMDKATYAAHFTSGDYRLMKLLFHEGLGAATLIFVVPGFILGLPVALWKKKRARFMEVYILLLPVLLYLMYRYIIPLANVRYLYPVLGLGVISGFYTLTALGIPKRALRLAVLVCVLASMAELAERHEFVAALLVSAAFFFAVPRLIRLLMRLSWESVVLPSAALMCIALIVFLGYVHNDYRRREYRRYIDMEEYSGFWPDATRAWRWLDEHTSGDNIAYVGRPVPYPLYGSRLKNNVFYVSVNTIEPALLHYYPDSRYRWGSSFGRMHENFREPANYRGRADAQVWLKNLAKRDTEYLFIYSLHQTDSVVFPLEDEWARARPEVFEPVFGNKTIRIYKVHT